VFLTDSVRYGTVQKRRTSANNKEYISSCCERSSFSSSWYNLGVCQCAVIERVKVIGLAKPDVYTVLQCISLPPFKSSHDMCAIFALVSVLLVVLICQGDYCCRGRAA
jgi:hypothetical protein